MSEAKEPYTTEEMPRVTPDERTETEKRFDELVAQRRKQGRQTYGKGLSWDDAKYRDKWPLMALEEALDGAQYLMAEVMRLEEENAELQKLGERYKDMWNSMRVAAEMSMDRENRHRIKNARLREVLQAVVDWKDRDESVSGFHSMIEDARAILEGKGAE